MSPKWKAFYANWLTPMELESLEAKPQEQSLSVPYGPTLNAVSCGIEQGSLVPEKAAKVRRGRKKRGSTQMRLPLI